MNEYGALVEWYWQGKTEVLGDKHYTASVVGEWTAAWLSSDKPRHLQQRHTQNCRLTVARQATTPAAATHTELPHTTSIRNAAFVKINFVLYGKDPGGSDVVVTRLWPGRCRVRLLAEARNFYLPENVPIRHGAHPASNSTAREVISVGVKRLTTCLHLVTRLRKSGAVPALLPTGTTSHLVWYSSLPVRHNLLFRCDSLCNR
jgi:hypothetical protein